MKRRILTILFAAAVVSAIPSSSIIAGTIASGNFAALNMADAGGVTQNATLNLTLASGNTISWSWGPVSSPQIIDFSGSFNFNNTYANITSTGSGSVTIGSVTYTPGANTTITLNLAFVGPNVPYSLSSSNCSQPNPNGNFCASTSGNPFTATGLLTVVNNSVTVFSDTLTGSGLASGSRILGNPVGGVSGAYAFSSTPEPATFFPIVTGLSVVLFTLNRRRHSRC